MSKEKSNMQTHRGLGIVVSVVQSVERFMKSHLAKGRVRRAISYVFTIPQQIERMDQELSDGLREFNVVALLDTNLRIRSGNQLADENARYNGEFRLLKHVEVDKFELILQEASEDGTLVLKYHCAEVDGRVVVVCYFETTPDAPGEGEYEGDATNLLDRTLAHDRILAEIS
ncbi:hypothetical protein AURDEDRAFT_176172 [Auricularia subglabra TFB-10046 SS5]|uniref:Uncharacterized protein n=1 Tax=Auricularia subglabra (strain TFB-10046 / SS5) TaxID=717982 RepID=J0WQF9_AURST|nr:hypothetical protein AURDEDRAFT_176172 [Auricularia subglabra TFB-10046 SS5]